MDVFTQTLRCESVCDTRSSFQGSRASWNSKFSFSETGCHRKTKEPGLPYYLPLSEARIDGFTLFPKELAWFETQTASCKVRTRVIDSISYDYNHHATSASDQFAVVTRDLPQKREISDIQPEGDSFIKKSLEQTHTQKYILKFYKYRACFCFIYCITNPSMLSFHFISTLIQADQFVL